MEMFGKLGMPSEGRIIHHDQDGVSLGNKSPMNYLRRKGFCRRQLLAKISPQSGTENGGQIHMLIIINADDLGASREVNDAIFDVISAGLVSSSTIMANGPFVEDGVQRAKKFTDISYGIHLNITFYSPLLFNEDLRPLLDAKGNFAGKSAVAKTSMTSQLANAIYKEFCNQIERLISLGINISHIDSHEHIHTLPAIFPILKRIQKRYDLWKVRITRNIYLPDYNVSAILRMKKMLYNFALRNYNTTKTTAGFGSLTEFYSNAKKNNLNYKTIEVMVHPGSEKFRDENKILKPNWYSELPFRIKLINFHQL
jgi:predicted glycoside hydrolase/deacetylase ChbG (UPF0249 family)